MKKFLHFASALSICVVYALPASAQSIDYGSLEDLFGEPVTTSATGKPQKSSEVPVAMDIISADEIRRTGAQSIPEVLDRVNGVMNWQGTRNWSDVGVRGQNTTLNPTLLVLVNGRQVYIDTYGYTNWSLLPVQMEEIRQIEVVKGPNTALFGFNAVSGVVNIVTYNPKYDNVGEGGVTVGSEGYREAYFMDTMKLHDKFNARVSGGLKRANEFDSESPTSVGASPTLDENRLGNFNLDSITQLTDTMQLRLEGGYAEAKANDKIFTNLSQTDQENYSGKATLSAQTSVGLVEASLYRNELDNNNIVTGAAIDNEVTVAQIQDLFKIGTDHSFRVQGEYRFNELSGSELIGAGADMSYQVYSAGGMWNWAISPEWELTNALRVDHLMLEREGPAPVALLTNDDFDQDITELSVNSGVVYKATDYDTLRLSYGRGVQAPSLVTYGINLVSSPGVVVLGNPDTDAAIVSNYEFGYDRVIPAIDGKFRGSVFYKQTEDVFVLGADSFLSGSNFILQFDNIGDTSTYGTELEIGGKIQQAWSWDLGYTYQTTNDEYNIAGIASTNYEDTFPHHVFNAHLGWAQGPWAADTYGQFSSNFDAITSVAGSNRLVEIDSYYTLGARLAYTFEEEVTLALSGNNLSHGSQETNGGLEEERQLFVTISKKF